MLPRLEVAHHRIGHHAVEFIQGVALGGDAAAVAVVPARDVAAGLVAGRHLKGDFFHGWSVRGRRGGRNGENPVPIRQPRIGQIFLSEPALELPGNGVLLCPP